MILDETQKRHAQFIAELLSTTARDFEALPISERRKFARLVHSEMKDLFPKESDLVAELPEAYRIMQEKVRPLLLGGPWRATHGTVREYREVDGIIHVEHLPADMGHPGWYWLVLVEDLIRPNEPLPWKLCPECSVRVFVPRRSDQTYCTRACTVAAVEKARAPMKRRYAREYARKQRLKARKEK